MERSGDSEAVTSVLRQGGWRLRISVFLLALGVVAGSGYTMYVHYDFSYSPDTRSYLSMARGDFQNAQVTRRYRVPVPFAAAAVAWPLERVYTRIWPHRAQEDWPLRLAFFLVNGAVLGLVGWVLFRTCLLHGATAGAAALAVACTLASRWSVYIVGLPLVDSLFLLLLSLVFYSACSGSRKALILCILLGPHAKESFFLLVPWILLFCRGVLPPVTLIALLAASTAVTLGVRHWIDGLAGARAMDSVENAFDHFVNLPVSLQRLISVRGLGEIFSIFGFFFFIPLAGCFGGRPARRRWLHPLGWRSVVLLGIIAAHMALSTCLGRMGYLSAPVFAVACSLILTTHPFFGWLGLGGSGPEQGEPPRR